MSQFRILPKDDDLITIGGWDPYLQTYFLKVFHWTMSISETPFFWRGKNPGEFPNLEEYVKMANKFSYFSESAKQILIEDKLANHSNAYESQRLLSYDLHENLYDFNSKLFVNRFEKFILNTFCNIDLLFEEKPHSVEFYFKNIYGNQGIGRFITETTHSHVNDLDELRKILRNNGMKIGYLVSFNKFTHEEKIFAEQNSIVLMDFDEFKRSSYYWWRINRIICELIRHLDGIHYPYDHGYRSRSNPFDSEMEFMQLGRRLFEIGGIQAIKGAFDILYQVIDDISLLNGLKESWNWLRELGYEF